MTSGRRRVRRMTASMSRSTNMLMALAPPAARVPPTRVATISDQAGKAPGGHDHGRQRGDQQQLDDPGLGRARRTRRGGAQRDLARAAPAGPRRTSAVRLRQRAPAQQSGAGPTAARRWSRRVGPRAGGGPTHGAPDGLAAPGRRRHAIRRSPPGPAVRRLAGVADRVPPDRRRRGLGSGADDRLRRRRPADRLGPGLPGLAGLHERPSVVAPLQFHAWVEFGNRLINAFVTVAAIGALDRRPPAGAPPAGSHAAVGRARRRPAGRGRARRAWSSSHKLAPGLVMAHFLLGMVFLADAVVLHHRAGSARRPTAGAAAVPLVGRGRRLRWPGCDSWPPLAVVTFGTVVTSTGPHGGDPKARRFGFSLHSVAQLHGTSVEVLLAITCSPCGALARTAAPRAVIRRAEIMLVAMVAQAAVGYTQYFNGDPVGLVAVHVAGASVAGRRRAALLPGSVTRRARPAGGHPVAGRTRRRHRPADGLSPSVCSLTDPRSPCRPPPPSRSKSPTSTRSPTSTDLEGPRLERPDQPDVLRRPSSSRSCSATARRRPTS